MIGCIVFHFDLDFVLFAWPMSSYGLLNFDWDFHRCLESIGALIKHINCSNSHVILVNSGFHSRSGPILSPASKLLVSLVNLQTCLSIATQAN